MDRRCFSKTKARSPCTEVRLWITALVCWPAKATSWRSAVSATPNSKPTAAMCSDLVIPRSSCRLAFLICPWHSVAPRSGADSAAFDLARRAGHFGLVPYLGSESAWGLASAIATQSGEPVWVAAPGPQLSRRVNDKVWFSERVTEVLGRQALPHTYRVYGPEALARRIALLVRSHESVCIKFPTVPAAPATSSSKQDR